jgi:hypothetical protein
MPVRDATNEEGVMSALLVGLCVQARFYPHAIQYMQSSEFPRGAYIVGYRVCLSKATGKPWALRVSKPCQCKPMTKLHRISVVTISIELVCAQISSTQSRELNKLSVLLSDGPRKEVLISALGTRAVRMFSDLGRPYNSAL